MPAITVTVAIVALVAASAAGAHAATKPIKVADDYYVRSGEAPTLTVRRNDIVVWNFVGQHAHSVHSEHRRMRFQSRPMTSGRYAQRMRRTGIYPIFCDIHGKSRMRMTLRVIP